MASERIVGKLQTPVDDDGLRKDIDLITSADAVVIDDENTLSDFIEKFGSGITISETQPSYPCMWGQPIRTEVIEE